MKKFLSVAIIGASFLCSTLAFSQEIVVATGSKKGTYSTMFSELNARCGTNIKVSEVNTNGSNSNIDLLVNNKVNSAFTQTDVLFYRARTEDLKNVKTLLVMHPEEVHLVSLAHSVNKEGGTMGIGGDYAVLKSITDLKGRVVGAVGGSFITAQVIRLQSEISYQTRQYEDNDKLLAALNKGDVDVALMVGGSPLSIVSSLDTRYRLLTIPEAVQAKLKSVYRPANLNYSRMRAAGVPTVATESIFVTRNYKTAKMMGILKDYRTCAVQSLGDLQETIGTHAKWQVVDFKNHGKWEWYMDTKE